MFQEGAEPSEFRDIIEAEVKRALEWMRGRDKPLPAKAIKPGRYRMTQTTEMMVDVVEGIHGLFVMSDYWNLPIEQFYHSGVTFQADDNAEYIRADLVLSERHQRLVEAARDLLNAVTVLCGDEYSCFSTCSLANECDKDSGNECLLVARLKAALEGEG